MKFKHPNDLKVSLDAIETHVDECIRNNDDLNCGIISTDCLIIFILRNCMLIVKNFLRMPTAGWRNT